MTAYEIKWEKQDILNKIAQLDITSLSEIDKKDVAELVQGMDTMNWDTIQCLLNCVDNDNIRVILLQANRYMRKLAKQGKIASCFSGEVI